MRCQVLLFAQLAERIGHRELDIELADDATVGDALDALCREHAVIGALRDRIAVAVDEVYEAEATILTDGCTMALIPPVSGG